VPCGRDEWRQALEPALRAVNRDKKNFCSGYFSVSMFDPGPWRFEINIVDGANPDARTRVEQLLQPGAPVEWRAVKYSWKDLDDLMHRHAFEGLVETGGHVRTVFLDVVRDTVTVETLGEQPQLAADLTQRFGDMVTVVTGSTTPLMPL
jgi:hypothetical protein